MWVIPRLTHTRTHAQGINFDEWRLYNANIEATKLKFFSHFFQRVEKTRSRYEAALRTCLWVFSVFQYMCIGMFHQDNYAYFMHLFCVHAIIAKWWWTWWWWRWSSSKLFKCTFEVYSMPRYTFIYTECEQLKFIEFNVRWCVCARFSNNRWIPMPPLCSMFALCE